MFTIGDFARHGRVSVRMLRHYDAIGLLQPARVDPRSGYRHYEGAQLARLNRIVALKDLGFTLQQVQVILDEQVDVGELRGMLRLRQAELAERLAADSARLAGVEARLRTIEREGRMPADDVVIKSIPAVRVAELSDLAAGFRPEDIGPVIQPLYCRLRDLLKQADLAAVGKPIAYYEAASDGVIVHAAIPVAADPDGRHGFAMVDLPEIRSAATIIHRGSMDFVMPSVQTLAQWIEANGYRSDGYPRELYLECPADADQWVAELQEPVRPGATSS